MCFSKKITVFHGRKLSEENTLIGYGALIEYYQLPMPLPENLAVVSESKKNTFTQEWSIFEKKYLPEDTLYKHLVFALKHEGLNLLFFKKLFQQMGSKKAVELLKNEPMGQYTRKMWFLYEWLLNETLPIKDLKSGNYVPLINEKKQFCLSKGERSKRHRIVNNLPGTPHFCPLVFKTTKLQEFGSKDYTFELGSFRKGILQRSAAFLLLKDSKASFTIEGENPINKRAARWGQAIGQAGLHKLTFEELLRLQQIVIENPRFITMGLRKQGGFIGEHDRITGEPIPEHISAKWQDVEELVNGLIQTDELIHKNEIDAVVAASIIAFGFVFIHPFQDGNGRIHRYLIHHVLQSKKMYKQGVIFPISAVILEDIDAYRFILEKFSKPLLEFIEWKETPDNNVEVLNDTADYYKYFDATKQTEFLYECVDKTIHETIPNEMDYLIAYDAFKKYIDNEFEMPDKLVATLVRFLEQNQGKLSGRAIKKEFSALSASEIIKIENEFSLIFLEK